MTAPQRHVVVVGGGVAGVAAAWSAARAGARTTLLHAGAGASMLYSGALDFQSPPSQEASVQLALFATALGTWRYGAGPCRVATQTGLCRSADGRDGALLDLEPLAGKCVGVVDALHTSWDARLATRELAAGEWALKTATRFVTLSAPDLLLRDEISVPPYDLAIRFDDPARLRRMCEVLEAVQGEAEAFLIGPWLGFETDVASAASKQLGAAVGETTSGMGGIAGARFERARNRLLAGSGVDARVKHVDSVDPTPKGLLVQAGSESLEADAVVLAIGGVAAGGIVLDDARPEHPGGACFHTSLRAPVNLRLDDEPVEKVSTLHGVDFCLAGLGTLERVGIAAKEGKTACPELYVAGDCVADGPRTALDAASSGIAVGAFAAEPAVS